MKHDWKKVEAGWYRAEGIGSVRAGWTLGISGKWWIIPRWLNEDRLGPYRTKAMAISEAEHMLAIHDGGATHDK